MQIKKLTITMIDGSLRLSLNARLVILRFLLALLLAFPVLVLTSCVEGEEEVWLNADGSGHLLAHYRLPSVALKKLGDPDDFIRALKLIDEKEDRIEITSLIFAKKGSKVIFHLEATFEDARELLEISDRNKEFYEEETGCEPNKIDGIIGALNFNLKGLTPSFERAVSPAEVFPPLVTRRPKMLGSASFKYTLHLPIKVVETNAHEISDEGKTVSWTFRLSEHFENPMTMSFAARIPIPWWGWAILALLAFALAWLTWRFVIRRYI